MTISSPPGFLASPPSGVGPGVLILHAWWGLNDTIKTFCRRLADEGFTVFAPELYHGVVVDTIPEAEKMVAALDTNHLQAKAEIKAAVSHLLEHTSQPESALAVIGFSLGAFYALDLSAADPVHIQGVVVFYGSGDADFSAARASYQGHFAERDPFEPPENVTWLEGALKDAGRPVTFYQYEDTGHWFMEPDRADAFHPVAADLAWARTLAFLKGLFGM